MDRDEVRARIEEIGIIPAVRVSSPDDAIFAATAVNNAGIPIAEITVTVPRTVDVISQLRREIPKMVVGAGTILDVETARRCLDSGAQFLTSPGLVLEIVEFAIKHRVVVFPGALSPSEIITASKAGVDFVKVFPCANVGGDHYIRALKAPFPHISLIAAGGVNQQTAFDFIMAGSAALGVGVALIPNESVQSRSEDRIRELARRFTRSIKDARGRLAARKDH
jgi:2-dehydro-3-deoxyphosphogluconate aldolase/(4S)-4-hydroxy-2-oxoglutarate aldolase